MTASTRSVVHVLAFVFAVLLGAWLLEAVALHIGVARADAALVDAGSGSGSALGSAAAAATPAISVTVPDPTQDPLGDASAVAKLWKAGAIAPALLIAAFAILTVLANWIGLLKEGKRAAYTAAFLTFLGACVPYASQGQLPPLALVLTLATSVLALVLHPAPADAKASA